MSIYHVVDAIRHLRAAFEIAGMEAPVSSFRELKKLIGRELVLVPTKDEDDRVIGPCYVMLAGQRIDECLF